jgi:hypothetical protein
MRDNYQDELRRRTGEIFDPDVSLCKIYLALLKTFPTPPESSSLLSQCFGMLDEFLYYARQAECRSGRSESLLLDELDRVNTEHAISRHRASTQVHWTTRPGDLKSPGSCCELAPRSL